MAERSRILIVDDEAFNVDYLEQELELLGYETDSAFSGREALEKVDQRAPDLILLDIMMPDIDGYTVCRMLKDDRKTRLIPVVIMTSLNATEDRIKGIEAGADDFLTKPVNEQELMARIRTALKFKRAVDDEIGELRRMSDHLSKFVPDAVKRLVSENPESPDLRKREQDVSVLFVDISGYARLSEKMAPEVLNMLVERYFSTFLDRIHDSNGEVSETSGDGLMAIFQDGDPKRHAVKATDTALALLAANEALNEENSIQPLAIHVGVNSGPALVGSTRFQGQRGVRWVFTADGPVINLAARLADMAKEGEIVAGPETIARLADRYPLERLARARLKNLAEPVETFRVLGPPSAKKATRRIRVTEKAPGHGGERRLGTILSIKISHSSNAEPDDEGTIAARLAGHRDEIGQAILDHRGQMLDERGDALMAEFGSPVAAVHCAIALQHSYRDQEEDQPGKDASAQFGIGVGYIAIEEGHVIGEGVDLATGLGKLARPGEIWVSDVVWENARSQVNDKFDDLGEYSPDGVSRPLRVYRLGASRQTKTIETPVASSASEPEGPTGQLSQNSTKADLPNAVGLPWPDSYKMLRQHMEESWGLSDGLYLNRILSGKSGALVFAVDITSRGFGGQAILKLDKIRDPSWSEDEEAERHRQATEVNQDFAAKHLPSIVHTCQHAGQIAILSTIVGRGLEYARPWSECLFDQQLASVGRLSRDLLEEWNSGYTFAAGIQRPSALLNGWLQYRLDPAQGRIHSYLSEHCGVGTREPAFMFEGHWYPNPIAFADEVYPLPDRVQLRAAIGNVHGDLHGFNVLVKPLDAKELEYYLIDLALYKSGQYLFYDHAYFELAYLLHVREGISLRRFKSILDTLGISQQDGEHPMPSGDDLGLIRLLTVLRQEEFDWIERHEPHRLSYLECQRLLARIAVGLNFVNKPLSREARHMALLYSAHHLKHYVKFQSIDWSRHGQPLKGVDGG